MNRIAIFNEIVNSFKKSGKLFFSSENACVIEDDALVSLRDIPDHSISLLLTDPPYHSTKKDNIINDCSFDSDEAFIEWIESFALEWKRILRPNGSGFMFCSSSMEAKLEIMLSKHFNILAHITWTKPNEPGYDGWKGKMKKEALRQWYPHSERIIFFESSGEGNLKHSNFGNMLKDYRKQCHLTCNQLTELIGAYGKVNHGGAVCNWEAGRNIPDREQYAKISKVIFKTGGILMPEYEDAIRPFNVSSKVEFTDVWTFPSVKQHKGKHPAEKPISLLEHCINATSYEGDIVLDCFAGSGNTLIAAQNLNRYSIGIEIDKQWCQSAAAKIGSLSIF